MKQTDYSIIDHLVTVGTIPDPVEDLTRHIKWLRSAGRIYFKFQVPFYKSFSRLSQEDGFLVKTIGMELDNNRMHRELKSRVYTAPAHYMAVYTPVEVLEITGIFPPVPELFGAKLREYKELTGKEWKDRE